VPPVVAGRALLFLRPDQRTARPNLVQPPMTWLIQQARQLSGRLVGALATGRAFVRFDGIQVPASVARELAARVAAAWPASRQAEAALAAATAEAWPSWTSATPTWSGTGPDLLVEPAPAGTAVVGLWWD
jgi:hypothetical protein